MKDDIEISKLAKQERSRPYSALGSLLAVLRLGRGFTRDELAARLDLDMSYAARIERGDRRPSAKTTAAWLNTCSVPILPAAILAADLSPWLSPSGWEKPAKPEQDWALSHVVSAGVDMVTAASWAVGSAAALHWPPPERLMSAVRVEPALLGDVVWLCIRAGRHHRLEVVESITGAEMRRHGALDDTWAESSWLRPLWEGLRAIAADAPASDPTDVLWNRLARIWPTLPLNARRGLLAAAEAWNQH